jgi:hypothetical protein
VPEWRLAEQVVPIMMRLIRRTLAAENAMTLFFIPS